jgi:amino acid adenylation domain-containing protein
LSGWGSGAASRLLTLWSLLLKRATRQSTLALAVACDGRADAELSEVMGPLTRHLPLSLTVDEQERLERAGERAHAQLEGLLEWQDYYRADVLRTGEDAGYLAHGFAYTEVPAGVPEVLGYGACAERSHAQLTVLSQSGSWRLLLDYDASRLEGAAMERLLRQYRSLLQSAVEMPQARLCELSHVGDEERRRLLSPSSADALPGARTVVELFSAEAARVPGRAALRAGERVWTYAELDAASNRLAHYLIGQGVEAESRVAVCLDREPQWIVSLLGVLKAGGVYVPIDPEFHPERVRSLLEDADCALWLSDGAHAGVLGEGGARLRLLDALEETLSGYPTVAPQVRTEPEALAYLIYTSGSTGRPKGVGVSHGAVHAYVAGVLPRLGLSEEAELLSLATIGADLGHTALFGALCSGRTLRLIASSSVLDAEGLAEELGARPVDCLKIVPTHLRALLSASSPSRLLPRECLVLGGSALESGLVETVRGLSSCRIVNHYGPTETTVGATTHAVEGAVEGALPIGRALSGGRTYVLDAEGRLAGEGMPGELYIGGPAVARGYWGRPDLTAERFVPDAWSGEPGARMYRTGDLADVREGVVRFYGRVDHQVKIRGYRVELGEIESVLSGHPEVESACVVLSDGERLLGYVASSGTPSGGTLREWLRDRLPEYMVPSGWHVMRHLPVTRNGKVDRSALPAIGDQGVRTRAYVAPRTELERTLAQLWSEVLGVEEVGVEDDFFELGGYSLLVTQMLAWTKKLSGTSVPLRAFFEAPRISAMAAIVEGERSANAGGPVLQAVPRGPRAISSYGQQRLWVTQQLGGGPSDYNTPHIWELRGRIDVDALSRAFAMVAERNEILRTRFSFQDGTVYQHVDAPAPIPLPQEDMTGADDAALRARLEAEASRPFDLTAAPLFRLLLLRCSDERHLFSLVMHHIVSDGWSMGVLQREWSHLYAQILRGEAPSLPSLPLQYADYAIWQRSMIADGHWRAQLDYWRAQLAGLSPAELPADPSAGSGGPGTVTFRIPLALSDAIRRCAHERNLTPFMVVVAGLDLLLQRHAGRDDIAIGTSVAGRNHAEISESIGFFVNQLVLRTDLADDPTVEELLLRVRRTVLGALDHQDLPFSLLVSELPAARGHGRTPFFQLLVVLQDFPDEALHLPALTAGRWQNAQPSAKFDISLYLGTDDAGMQGTWVYDGGVFSAATVERLARHLPTLLAEIVERPQARIGELKMWSEKELADKEEVRRHRKAEKFGRLKAMTGNA